MILLALALQTATATVGPPSPEADRHRRCMRLALDQPAAAVEQAQQWRLAGGGHLARQCLGVAFATQRRWASAADAFEDAARAAEAAKDVRSATYWAQAGNAWLAGGDALKARAALNAALASGLLTEFALGEAHLDRARALVAAGQPEAARTDLDRALALAGADPLAWLLSATLARREGDLARARKDIAEAVKRSPDDASVQLEAGNIAALSGDTAGARAAFDEAIRLAPTRPQAAAARAALAQLPPGQ